MMCHRRLSAGLCSASPLLISPPVVPWRSRILQCSGRRPDGPVHPGDRDGAAESWGHQGGIHWGQRAHAHKKKCCFTCTHSIKHHQSFISTLMRLKLPKFFGRTLIIHAPCRNSPRRTILQSLTDGEKNWDVPTVETKDGDFFMQQGIELRS